MQFIKERYLLEKNLRNRILIIVNIVHSHQERLHKTFTAHLHNCRSQVFLTHESLHLKNFGSGHMRNFIYIYMTRYINSGNHFISPKCIFPWLGILMKKRSN